MSYLSSIDLSWLGLAWLGLARALGDGGDQDDDDDDDDVRVPCPIVSTTTGLPVGPAAGHPLTCDLSTISTVSNSL